jgi:hypothetical protein
MMGVIVSAQHDAAEKIARAEGRARDTRGHDGDLLLRELPVVRALGGGPSPDQRWGGCANSACCSDCNACVTSVPPWPSAAMTKLAAM